MRAFRLLALRLIRQQPLRASIACVSVAAGIALLLAIGITTASVDQSVARFSESIAGPAPLRITGATARGGLVPESVDAARGVDGVAAVIPMIQFPTVADHAPDEPASEATTAADEPLPVLALGIDCSVTALLRDFPCTPELLDSFGTAPLAVGPEVASGLSIRTSGGRVAIDDGVVRLDTLEAVNDGRVVVFSLATMGVLAGQGDRVDVGYVLLDDGVSVASVRGALRDAVGPQNTIEAAAVAPSQVQLVLGSYIPLLGILGLFGLGTGVVLVRNTLILSLEERRRDMAIVGALGASPRRMIVHTIAEAALIGVVGGGLGALGAVAVSTPIVTGISSITERLVSIPITRSASPSTAVLGVVAGLVIATLSAIGPARRAASVQVAAELSGRAAAEEATAPRLVRQAVWWTAIASVALIGTWAGARRSGIDPWQSPVGQLSFLLASVSVPFVGASLAALGLVALGSRAKRLPAALRLGLLALVRDPKRTRVMVMAVGSPMIVAFAVAGFVASVEASVDAEFERVGPFVSVSTTGLGGRDTVLLSPEAIAGLATIPGVDRVRTANNLPVGGDGNLALIETSTDIDLDDFDAIAGVIDPIAFADGGALIGPAVARRTGARSGDIIEVPTATGIVELTTIAVVDSDDAAGNVVVIDPARFAELYGAVPPSYVNLEPLPGVSEDALVRNVEAAAPSIDPQLEVQSRADLTDTILESVNDQMLPFRAMQQALIITALIAVLSTLLLVGLQQRRSHGLLGAVGAAPSTLRGMVLAQAGLVWFAATAAGVLSGPPVLWALLKVQPLVIGGSNPYRADWSAWALTSAITGVVVIAGAAWPAKRAGDIDVLDALRSE